MTHREMVQQTKGMKRACLQENGNARISKSQVYDYGESFYRKENCPHNTCTFCMTLYSTMQGFFYWSYVSIYPWLKVLHFCLISALTNYANRFTSEKTFFFPTFALKLQLLIDQPGDHSDSCAEGWTAANGLSKRMSSKVSYLLPNRFDWLGKFCQWKVSYLYTLRTFSLVWKCGRLPAFLGGQKHQST